MSNGSYMSKALKAIGLVLTLGVSMSAVAGLFSLGNSEIFKEEVQLSDGRIVVIERETTRERGGDEWVFNLSGSKPKEYRIRFGHPDGAERMIEWHSIKEFETWPEIPLIFDVESGIPTIFSLVSISNGCEIYSKYVYRKGAWVEEPLQEKFEQGQTNLFFGNRKDMPSFVNVKEKHKRNSGTGYRRALKQVGPNRKVCG